MRPSGAAYGLDMTDEMLRFGSRTSGALRHKGLNGPTAACLVNHVHRLVLAICAGDPKQHREPADRAQATLLGELSTEDELVAEPIEVPTGLLPNPVHVHLVTISDPGRQLDA